MPGAIDPAPDSFEWRRVPSAAAPPYHVFTKPVRKSAQDDREYRIIKLDNGLEAMLVHDAKADKAAASLDVAVGHLYDPVGSLPTNFETMLTDARTTCRGWLIFANISCLW